MDKHLTTLETSLVLTLGVLTLFGTSGATLVGDTSLTVNRGEDAVFNWMFEADTDPNAEPYQYVWFKRDKNNIHFLTVQLPDRLVTDVDSPYKDRTQTTGQLGLRLLNVGKKDAGTYLLYVYIHRATPENTEITLHVKYPPTNTTVTTPTRGWSTVESLAIKQGETLRLTCSTDSNPTSNFTWTRLENKLSPLAEVNTTSGGLTIHNVQRNDTGTYQCRAYNCLRPDGSWNVNVTIQSELHQSNATKRAFKTTPRWVIPSYTSVAFAVYLSCITILWIWKAKVRKKDHNNDQDVNIFVVTEDYLPEYRSPSRAALLISGATSEEKMADPVVREFWDRLMTMDADRVLVFLQEKQILQADDAAGIRQAFSVVETLLETVSVLEKENSARVLSEALRHSEQQDLADLLEGKVLPDAKCLTVTNITDSTFSIEFQPAYTNVQHFGDVDSYVVTLAVAADEPQIIDTRDLLPSEPLHADFTDLNQGTSYNVTVVSKRGEVTSAGTTLTVTTIGGYEVPSPLLASLNPDERSQIHDVLISKDRITLQESLGKGYFGEVRRATCLRDNKLEFCAAKTLYDTSSHTEMESLLREGLRMIKFNHENVLRLTGICVHGNEAMIVLPYMKNGDLRKYLTNKQTLPLPENLRLCQEIAHGMAYLTDQGIVHRDLAARNCMLDDQSHLKVADFGLCRDVSEKGYYRIQHRDVALPAKWMAPESYEEQIFDTKTDVWSYGVVLWEIFSGGKTPYPGVHRFVIEYILDGNRMERPNMCPITL
ncbi:MET [Branchiostoma lanceolatum]|nr:MET [Branchiostoma lanceolatum]